MSVCLCLCIRNRSVRACEPVRSVCQCCTHACVLCRRNYGYVCVPAYVSHVRAVCVYMQVVKARIYTTSVSFLLSPLPAETVYIQSNPTRNALCVLKKKKKNYKKNAHTKKIKKQTPQSIQLTAKIKFAATTQHEGSETSVTQKTQQVSPDKNGFYATGFKAHILACLCIHPGVKDGRGSQATCVA